jgi:hypothetical protein
MVFGYDLLCDLLEMLNLINIGSAAATRINLVDPIQRTNMRGLKRFVKMSGSQLLQYFMV